MCPATFSSQEGIGSEQCQEVCKVVWHCIPAEIMLLCQQQHWAHGSKARAFSVLIESLAAALVGPFPDGKPPLPAPSTEPVLHTTRVRFGLIAECSRQKTSNYFPLSP